LALQCLPELNWKTAFVLMSVKSALIPLLLLGTVLHSTRWPGRLLQTPPLRWLGRLSYSLYLWQQLFLVWSEDRVPALAWLQSAPLNMLAVFACAWLSLRYVETPLIALGHRLTRRAPQPSDALVAVRQ
jgi:peptidoglycan/LPS O-acetylase OafA/YrhL